MAEKINTKEILDIQELAEYLGISSRTIRNLIHRKKIPYFRVGNLFRFRMTDISDWIKSRGGK